MEYEAVIGLEVHAQLLTKSKMFCSCTTDYIGASPNTRVCPVCLGMPGVLPVINRQAVEYTIMTGLTLNCTISEITKFDRKNYPYPDLMKGYQISQYDTPIAKKGWLDIEVDGHPKKAGITRVHLEEDVAKMIHRPDPGGEGLTLVDVNRSGAPLMEIVGEPDLRTPGEARHYLVKLRAILQYLGVSTGNMEDGSFRCDANISVRPKGAKELTAKVEVKNMNSFRAVYKALQYEAQRQVQVVERGERIVQETRGWVEEKGITVSQRSKEYAHDYRYFPEPDLPPLVIDKGWVQQIRSRLPELPEQRRDRLMESFGLPLYDANLITATKASAEFFEATLGAKRGDEAALRQRAKAASNWLLGEMARLLNAHSMEIDKVLVTPAAMSELLNLIEGGQLSTTLARTVFEQMFLTGKGPAEIIHAKGYLQITDSSSIDTAVEEAVAQNPKAVADYLAGKEQALKYVVGQVMRVTRGQANPGLVNERVKAKLEALKKR